SRVIIVLRRTNTGTTRASEIVHTGGCCRCVRCSSTSRRLHGFRGSPGIGELAVWGHSWGGGYASVNYGVRSARTARRRRAGGWLSWAAKGGGVVGRAPVGAYVFDSSVEVRAAAPQVRASTTCGAWCDAAYSM